MKIVRTALESCNFEIDEEDLPEGIINDENKLRRWIADNCMNYDFGPLRPIFIEIEDA